MPLNEVANQKIFKGLTCPYTGKPITVRVIAAGGRPLFFSPDAFDPSFPMVSLKALLQAAGTRGGVIGFAAEGKELICPYTGKKMSIIKLQDGTFRLKGGFRPSNPMESAEAFSYAMRTRDGVPPEGPIPQPVPSVIFADTSRLPAFDKKAPAPKDFALEYAEDALKGAVPVKTRIMVPNSTLKNKKVKR